MLIIDFVVDVVVVFVVVAVVVANVDVVAFIVVTGHIIFSCGQLDTDYKAST